MQVTAILEESIFLWILIIPEKLPNPTPRCHDPLVAMVTSMHPFVFVFVKITMWSICAPIVTAMWLVVNSDETGEFSSVSDVSEPASLPGEKIHHLLLHHLVNGEICCTWPEVGWWCYFESKGNTRRCNKVTSLAFCEVMRLMFFESRSSFLSSGS
jgi:hypothetical protein